MEIIMTEETKLAPRLSLQERQAKANAYASELATLETIKRNAKTARLKREREAAAASSSTGIRGVPKNPDMTEKG